MHNGSLATLRDVVRHYSELDEDRLHADKLAKRQTSMRVPSVSAKTSLGILVTVLERRLRFVDTRVVPHPKLRKGLAVALSPAIDGFLWEDH